MLIIVLLLALMLTLLGLYISRDIFAPYVVGPGVWAIIILLYYFVPNNYYPVCHDFPLALLIWLFSFSIVSCVVSCKVASSNSNALKRFPNKNIIRIYVIITVTVVPIMAFMLIWQAFTEEPETMFRYLRVMATGIGDDIEAPDFGPFVYAMAVAYIAMFFVVLYSKSKIVIVLVVLMNLLIAFVQMAKINFLTVLFTLTYLGYVRGVLKLRHFAYLLVGFLVLSFFLQVARFAGDDSQVGLSDSLSLYTTSAMVCFDYFLNPGSSLHFGEHVFRLLYAIGHPLGLCGEPVSTIEKFVSIPELANTYTVLSPFYVDFGYIGIVLFSIIYGVIYGYLYKKSKTGGTQELIIYAIFLVYLILEFFAELIFANLSMTIQYIILSILPFALNKKQCINYT